MIRFAVSERGADLSQVFTSGARTFFGVPPVVDLGSVTAQVAFLGVPFDGGTPQPGNRTGQKLGPAAARQASWEQFAYGESLEDGSAGWYDIESDRDRLRGVTMVDVGDVVIQGADDHGNFARPRFPSGRVAPAPELAATRRPLRQPKRQPLIEDRDVRPRDLHACARPRPCLLEIDGSANGYDCRRA